MERININKLEELEAQGWLKSQVHPTLPLRIWNYSQQTQWEKYWNDITLMCRGLVTDKEGNIVARPLKKFFNFGELNGANNVPQCGFRVFEKYDGSLIQVFWYEDQWVACSKGSFTSPHALYATEILKSYGIFIGEVNEDAEEMFETNMTYIFELIHPDVRIVVDYGQKQSLILLAVIETATGVEQDLNYYADWFEVAQEVEFHPMSMPTCFEDMFEEIPDNREGFVIVFDNGERMKIKGEEYCRLHRIITMTSSYDIWEALKTNNGLGELLERVPDEWMDWVHQQVGKMYLNRRQILFQVLRDLAYGQELGLYTLYEDKITALEKSRRVVAEYFNTCMYPKLLFNILDDRSIDTMLWEMVKPEHEKAFSV